MKSNEADKSDGGRGRRLDRALWSRVVKKMAPREFAAMKRIVDREAARRG